MLFNTLEYWGFFLVVLALFYSVPFRLGRWVLLISSIFFYMCWNPKFIILLGGITILDYFAGILIAKNEGKSRKAWLTVSLVANLGILFFFKYYNFFASTVAVALGQPADSFFLNVILPLGISFHTFQSMSYTIDVYRKKTPEIYDFIDFSLFIMFFPQLVAGPIVRAQTFFPELRDWKVPAAKVIESGVILVFVGLIKKAVFADHMAKYADAYFNNVHQDYDAYRAWAGVLSFGLQIFFDFSGYTDIARGCARILGFEFPVNFARPYLSKNIAEFWRRWHISLSSWLRDYLYISLGGNQISSLVTYRNLILTMVIGGFWHGASWNFIIWGAYHGGLLAIHRYLSQSLKGTPVEEALNQPWLTPFKVGFTFFLVMIGWIPFRAATLSDSWTVFKNLFHLNPVVMSHVHSSLLLAMAVSGVLALAQERYQIFERIENMSALKKILYFTTALLLLQLFSYSEKSVPFVYFQF